MFDSTVYTPTVFRQSTITAVHV